MPSSTAEPVGPAVLERPRPAGQHVAPLSRRHEVDLITSGNGRKERALPRLLERLLQVVDVDAVVDVVQRVEFSSSDAEVLLESARRSGRESDLHHLEGGRVGRHEPQHLLGYSRRYAALVGHHPIDLDEREQLARSTADLRAAMRRDATEGDYLRAHEDFAVGWDGPQDVEPNGSNQPEEASGAVPVAAEAEQRRMLPGDVGGPGEVDRGAHRLGRRRLLEPDSIWPHDPIGQPVGQRVETVVRPVRRSRRAGIRGGTLDHRLHSASSSSDSRATRRVPPCSAVARSSRSSHERRASKTTRATSSATSSSAAWERASSS